MAAAAKGVSVDYSASLSEDAPAKRGQRTAGRGRKVIAFLVGGVVLGVLTVGAAALWLDTASGHQYVTRQINDMEFANGLDIHIGSIDGNIYKTPVLRRIILSDRDGVFATVSEAQVVWDSFQLGTRHLDIKSANLRGGELLRLPNFTSNQASSGSFLTIDRIDIGQFESPQMQVTVPHGREIISTDITGAAHIDGAYWKGRISVRTEVANSGQPKDVIELKGSGNFGLTDLAVDGSIRAGANGLVAGFTGKAVPVQATLEDSNSLGPLEPIFD
jgi:translocation and assembly module TamB